MSSTNKTTYYELPQFVDNDIFNPLVDDNDAYSKIDTALHNIADAEAGDASEIVSVKSRLDSAEGAIDALEAQNGNSVLTTTAQTLSGAVNELDADASALDGRLDVVEDDINNASTGLKAKVSTLENTVGSGELDTDANTLVGAVNELNSKQLGHAMFYFPSIRTGTFQSASCMMVVDKKAIIFDVGAEDSRTELMAYYNSLYSAGVFDEVVKIIISHFHIDHMGNISQILGGFPCSNCTVYIPLNPDGYFADAASDGLLDNRAAIITACQTANVPYVEVTTDTDIEIDNLVSIQLFNSTIADYTYYSTNAADYNNYSMISLVKIGQIYAMFAGDIETVGQLRVIATKTLPRLFLFAINHHGLQWNDSVAFMNMIQPEWGVAQISPNKARDIDGLLPKYCVNHVCMSCYGSHVFAVNEASGYIVSGTEVNIVSGSEPHADIYVDNSYAGTDSDGSEAKPFVDINDAIKFVKNGELYNKIFVKATANDYALVKVNNVKNLQIIGVANGTYTMPKVNGIHINLCGSILLSNIDFNLIQTIDNGIIGVNTTSFVNIDSCHITGDASATYKDFGIVNLNSSVYVAGCTFTNTRGTRSIVFGTFYVAGNTFVDCAYAMLALNSKIYIKALDVLTNTPIYLHADNSSGSVDVGVSFSSAVSLDDFKALVSKNSNRIRSDKFIVGSSNYAIFGKEIIEDVPFHGDSWITDLNDAIEAGFYSFLSTASNIPTSITSSGGGRLMVMRFDENYLTQFATFNESGNVKIGVRKLENNVWGGWYILIPTSV